VRRRRSKPDVPAIALDERERLRVNDNVSLLDGRLDRLESLLQDVMRAVDLNSKRLNAVQAQLDHLAAKVRAI